MRKETFQFNINVCFLGINFKLGAFLQQLKILLNQINVHNPYRVILLNP